jgi:hypothetical protein
MSSFPPMLTQSNQVSPAKGAMPKIVIRNPNMKFRGAFHSTKVGAVFADCRTRPRAEGRLL